MFSAEALSHILTEADRIVQDAQELLDSATATGEADLIEAASNNLRQVIENRARLNRVFALRLISADAPA
jgi:hypothetical protein